MPVRKTSCCMALDGSGFELPGTLGRRFLPRKLFFVNGTTADSHESSHDDCTHVKQIILSYYTEGELG